jgi:membrane fusion protein, multidrug efflux system
MSRNVLQASVLCLFVGLVSAGCGGESTTAAAEPPPTAPVAIDVPVVVASVGPIEATLEISGTLTPRSRVGVKPKLPGTLERILVDIGAPVQAGQVVATLDRRELDAQVDAAVAAVGVAKAGLESAEAALANAVLELERARNLFEKGALPRQRLDSAETAHRASVAQRELAKANLAQAEAALRRAREVQRDATLTSPVTGFIVERNYDPGAIPGDEPIVVVADVRQMKLEAGVSELEAGRLRVGMPARIEVQARPGETFSGELAAIAPEVDERNRHFPVEVRVANPDRALLSGMYATARLALASAAQALTVPREAVTTRDGKRVVLKVEGESLRVAPVTEGLNDGRRVQITSGLSPGELVIADARRQLPDGARVNAVRVN